MNVIEIGIQALTGGITGYVTNTTAVKMIFKKVLGFGGVIIETREEFIENVSQLVEKEIINHGTLQSELSKEEFNLEVTKIVNDFLQKQLYDVTQDIRVGQIPKMNHSLNNLLGFFNEKQGGVIYDVLRLLSEAISLRDILSEEQLQVFVGQVIDMSIGVLQETEILDSFLASLYSQYGDANLAAFIPPKVFDTVTENLNNQTGNLHCDLEENFDQAIDQLMDELYAGLDISLIVERLEKRVKDKSIIELFGRTHAENISNELLQHILQFMKSPEGKILLSQTSDYLFGILKETRMPLFDLFQPQLAENMTCFLASKLPGLVNQFIGWVKQNQQQIEDRIEQALQTTLEEESGLSAWMKRLLYEQIAKSAFVSKFQVVGKMIQGIQDNVDVRVLSEDIASDLIDYLKNTNISEMIGSLEAREIFTSGDITQLLEKNMDKLAAQVDLKAADSYFNMKLGDLVQQSLAEPLEAYLKRLMLKFKQEFIYTPEFTQALQKELKAVIKAGSTQNLSSILSALTSPQSTLQTIDKTGDCIETQIQERSVSELKKAIIAVFDKRRDDFTEIAVQQSGKWLRDKKLSDIIYNTTEQYKLNAAEQQVTSAEQKIEAVERILINDRIIELDSIENKITENISKRINLYLKEQLEELQQNSIYSLYDRVNAIPNIGEKLADGSIHLLHHNLEAITQGQIASIVASNLSKLQNQQLQVVVEDFMGKELKPISWLGGFLGVLAGLGFGLAKNSFHITGSVSMALSVPIYAMVGYLTNKQALWMVFHPYHPWRVAGKDVPLTQGVIVKSKPRFARSMAHFVGEELLNPASSVKLFQANRANLSRVFIKSLSENNYQRVEKFLLPNTQLIASGLMKAGTIFVEKNRERWSHIAVEEIEAIALKDFELKHLEKVIYAQGLGLPNKLQHSLVKILAEGLQDERSLYQVLPKHATQSLQAGIDRYLDKQVKQLQEILRDKPVFDQKVASMLDQPFAVLIAQSLQERMTDEQKTAVKERIAAFIYEQLRSESNQQKVQQMVQTKIVKELDPDKKLRDLFAGNLFKTLENQVHPILEFLTEKAMDILDRERENLKNLAKQEAQKTNGYELANALLGLDATIEQVVDRVVDETAPEIIGQGREDFRAFILGSLHGIGQSRVGEIRVDLTEQAIADLVRNWLENPTLNNHLRILSGGMIESLTAIPLERMLGVAGIKKAEDLLHLLKAELDEVRKHLTEGLKTNEERMKLTISTVSIQVLEHMAAEITVRSVFAGVDQCDVQQLMDQILVRINQNTAYPCAVQEFTEAIINDASTKELKSILDPFILRHDLSRVISLLIQDEEAASKMNGILERFLEMFIIHLNDILEIETKDAITATAVESILNALEEQIADLVKTLDLSNITEREINEMEPGEIEELFNSFARRYFRKLEYYGLWGGLLGFLMDILIRL